MAGDRRTVSETGNGPDSLIFLTQSEEGRGFTAAVRETRGSAARTFVRVLQAVLGAARSLTNVGIRLDRVGPCGKSTKCSRMDPYLLLEVPHNATTDDIKKAYRRLAKQWHPDSNGGSKAAEERFKSIQSAYECLIDPAKRATVDLKRKQREQEEAARKARVEAERQARSATRSDTPAFTAAGPNWGVILLGVLAVAGIGATLSQAQAPRRRTRPVKKRRRRTRFT